MAPLVWSKSMRTLFFLLCLVAATGAAQAQTLKPGDTLSISVMQDSKLDRSVVIDPSGQISMPLAGHIRADGLTPQALENIIKNRLRSNYKDDSLDVTVGLTNSAVPEEDLKPKIFITGEILRPGSYVVRQKTTLMQAIALAVGPARTFSCSTTGPTRPDRTLRGILPCTPATSSWSQNVACLSSR